VENDGSENIGEVDSVNRVSGGGMNRAGWFPYPVTRVCGTAAIVEPAFNHAKAGRSDMSMWRVDLPGASFDEGGEPSGLTAVRSILIPPLIPSPSHSSSLLRTRAAPKESKYISGPGVTSDFTAVAAIA
jgi:hypothetical protein